MNSTETAIGLIAGIVIILIILVLGLSDATPVVSKPEIKDECFEMYRTNSTLIEICRIRQALEKGDCYGRR